jgi:hypothetical protein
VPLSDRSIAEHVGVHHDTVATWRKKLTPRLADSASQTPAIRQGKDGRAINTAPIAEANTARSKYPTGKKTKVAPVVITLLTDNHPLTFAQVFDWLIMQGVLHHTQCKGVPGCSQSMLNIVQVLCMQGKGSPTARNHR